MIEWKTECIPICGTRLLLLQPWVIFRMFEIFLSCFALFSIGCNQRNRIDDDEIIPEINVNEIKKNESNEINKQNYYYYYHHHEMKVSPHSHSTRSRCFRMHLWNEEKKLITLPIWIWKLFFCWPNCWWTWWWWWRWKSTLCNESTWNLIPNSNLYWQNFFFHLFCCSLNSD